MNVDAMFSDFADKILSFHDEAKDVVEFINLAKSYGYTTDEARIFWYLIDRCFYRAGLSK